MRFFYLYFQKNQHSAIVKYAAILFFLTFFIQVKAQKQGQEYVDSLLKELPKLKEDSNKVKLLTNLSGGYYEIDYVKAIKYGEEALLLSSVLDWHKEDVANYNNLGVFYKEISDYSNSMKYYVKAYDIYIAKGNNKKLADVYLNIGSLNTSVYNYYDAINWNLEALKLYQTVNYPHGVSSAYKNIGNNFYHLKNFSYALEYYDSALALSRKYRDTIEIGGLLNNIGEVYVEQNNYDEALVYHLESLKIARKFGLRQAIAMSLTNLSDFYSVVHYYTKAFDFGFQALDSEFVIGDSASISDIFAIIGGIYLEIATDTINKYAPDDLIQPIKKANLKKAIEYLSNCISIKNKNPYTAKIALYQLSQAERLLGNYRKAYEDLDQYSKINDTFFTAQIGVSIANIIFKHKFENLQKELNKKDTRNNKNINNFITTIIVFVFLTSMIVALIIRQSKLIRREKINTDRQNKLLREEQEKYKLLLLNVLPEKIANRLINNTEKKKNNTLADDYSSVSIIFIDIKGFTELSSKKGAKQIVTMLNDIFSIFDELAEKHGIEKIKTIGDCYMAVAGIPDQKPDHAGPVAEMALDIIERMRDYVLPDGQHINMRIGFHCGSVVGGVIGNKKFIFDVWGDSVNFASRMESTGTVGEIHCSEDVYKVLRGRYKFIPCPPMIIKGYENKGPIQTYFLYRENTIGHNQ